MSSTHTCSLRFRIGSIADWESSLDAGTTTWLVSPDQEETCSSLMDMFCHFPHFAKHLHKCVLLQEDGINTA